MSKSGNSKKPKKCGAKTRSGGKCKRAPVAGNKRCKLHGGASLIGPASGTFKHGRYSKLIPARLKERYEESLKDEELLSVREQIALTEAREAELVERLHDDAESATWTLARSSFDDLVEAIRSGSSDKLGGSIVALRGVLDEGSRIEGVWRELFKVQEHLRKLKDTERRRLETLKQTITVEQAFTLLSAILDVVRRYVTDRQALSSIGREIRSITTKGEESE